MSSCCCTAALLYTLCMRLSQPCTHSGACMRPLWKMEEMTCPFPVIAAGFIAALRDAAVGRRILGIAVAPLAFCE